jgi:hypothetical protein
MATSTVEFNGRSMVVNVESITPRQLSKLLKVPNLENQMLQDKDGNFYEMIDNKFDPGLKAGTIYKINFQSSEHEDYSFNSSAPIPPARNTSQNAHSLENDVSNAQPTPEPQSFYQKQKPSEPQTFEDPKEKFYSNNKIALPDNTAFVKSGKLFFGNIVNGCAAVEELVLLSASAPDVNLVNKRSLRVSIVEAVQTFGKSYSTAVKTIEEVKLRFNEIPTRIRQGLETFAAQVNSQQNLETLQNSIRACIEVLEKNMNLFEPSQSNFIELEQSIKWAQKEEEKEIELQCKTKADKEREMAQIEKFIYQKENDIKSMESVILSLTAEIEGHKRAAEKNKSRFMGRFTGSGATGDQNNELQDLKQQQSSAQKNKHQLENEVDDLKMKQIEVKNKIKNCKVKSSANWTSINDSLNKIISQDTEQTWMSIIDIVKAVESDVNEMQKHAMGNSADNENLINAALRVSINSWIICQCCDIYTDILRSHVIPLFSKVTSNFGLRLEEAQSKLSSEKTNVQNVKKEVEKLADTRLLEAIKNSAKVAADTDTTFRAIFSTTI